MKIEGSGFLSDKTWGELLKAEGKKRKVRRRGAFAFAFAFAFVERE